VKGKAASAKPFMGVVIFQLAIRSSVNLGELVGFLACDLAAIGRKGDWTSGMGKVRDG